jgi:hypothetical protein
MIIINIPIAYLSRYEIIIKATDEAASIGAMTGQTRIAYER